MRMQAPQLPSRQLQPGPAAPPDCLHFAQSTHGMLTPVGRLQSGSRHMGRSPHTSDTGEEPLLDSQKYARRTGPLQRLAQRLLPQSLLSAPLPFTRQCAPGTTAGPVRVTGWHPCACSTACRCSRGQRHHAVLPPRSCTASARHLWGQLIPPHHLALRLRCPCASPGTLQPQKARGRAGAGNGGGCSVCATCCPWLRWRPCWPPCCCCTPA